MVVECGAIFFFYNLFDVLFRRTYDFYNQQKINYLKKCIGTIREDARHTDIG